MRNTIYSVGVKDASEETWNRVFHKYQTEPVPSEKRKLMYALSNSNNLAVLKR